MRSCIETRRLVFIRKTLIGFILANIVMYLALTLLARSLIIAEKEIMMHTYTFMGIRVLESAWNALIIWSPGKHVVTIILTEECIGIYAIIAYALFVIIVPAVSLRNKLKGLAIGCSILFLGNIARIMVAGVVGVEQGFIAFRFFHDVIGGGFMIVLVAALWVDWVYRVFRYGGY